MALLLSSWQYELPRAVAAAARWTRTCWTLSVVGDAAAPAVALAPAGAAARAPGVATRRPPLPNRRGVPARAAGAAPPTTASGAGAGDLGKMVTSPQPCLFCPASRVSACPVRGSIRRAQLAVPQPGGVPSTVAGSS